MQGASLALRWISALRRHARVLVVSAPLLCFAGPAAADPMPSRFGPAFAGQRSPQPLRIESSLSVQVPLPAGSNSDEQLQLGEAVRKAIYGTAARECATLKDAFHVECRLQSVRINSNVQRRGTGTDILFINGTASYELAETAN